MSLNSTHPAALVGPLQHIAEKGLGDMSSLMRPDPPGTINPTRLSMDAWSAPTSPPDFGILASIASPEAQSPFEAPVKNNPPIPLALATTTQAFPRLTRISSDWDVKDEVALAMDLQFSALGREFEERFAEDPRPSARRVRAKYVSHHGYFQRQTRGGTDTYHVSPDPDAGPDASVVVDRHTASIYDAFLLRADVTQNVNVFYRQQVSPHPHRFLAMAMQYMTKVNSRIISQVVFSLWSGKYTFLAREGRVGLQSEVRHKKESTDLKVVTAGFRKEFREKTGLVWSERYKHSPRLGKRFHFVELDYRWSSARLVGELPDYKSVDVNIHEELRELMEAMLYGSPTRKDVEKEPQGGSVTSRVVFGAPYEQLSLWAVFLGFKTLQHISKYLESDRPICWKAMLKASSLYRSRIPFCAGHKRAPVVSSYHAIFLELRLLHSLWPRHEIADLLADVHLRGTLQVRTHKMLAQPLYRAYSSLRHGFRRLTDPSTLEFRELEQYLTKSCHGIHRLRIELRDIYRVFVKAGLQNPYSDWIEGKQGYDVCGEDRLLLWHGTPLDSLLGILDLGLQIRRRGATWTGTMFGNGIYLADASSKSATFCKHHLWDGEAVLLLCEADVGHIRCRSARSIENGHDVIGKPGSQYRSIEGLGKTGPAGWKDVGWELGGAPSYGVVRMVCVRARIALTVTGRSLRLT